MIIKNKIISSFKTIQTSSFCSKLLIGWFICFSIMPDLFSQDQAITFKFYIDKLNALIDKNNLTSQANRVFVLDCRYDYITGNSSSSAENANINNQLLDANNNKYAKNNIEIYYIKLNALVNNHGIDKIKIDDANGKTTKEIAMPYYSTYDPGVLAKTVYNYSQVSNKGKYAKDAILIFEYLKYDRIDEYGILHYSVSCNYAFCLPPYYSGYYQKIDNYVKSAANTGLNVNDRNFIVTGFLNGLISLFNFNKDQIGPYQTDEVMQQQMDNEVVQMALYIQNKIKDPKNNKKHIFIENYKNTNDELYLLNDDQRISIENSISEIPADQKIYVISKKINIPLTAKQEQEHDYDNRIQEFEEKVVEKVCNDPDYYCGLNKATTTFIILPYYGYEDELSNPIWRIFYGYYSPITLTNTSISPHSIDATGSPTIDLNYIDNIISCIVPKRTLDYYQQKLDAAFANNYVMPQSNNEYVLGDDVGNSQKERDDLSAKLSTYSGVVPYVVLINEKYLSNEDKTKSAAEIAKWLVENNVSKISKININGFVIIYKPSIDNDGSEKNTLEKNFGFYTGTKLSGFDEDLNTLLQQEFSNKNIDVNFALIGKFLDELEKFKIYLPPDNYYGSPKQTRVLNEEIDDELETLIPIFEDFNRNPSVHIYKDDLSVKKNCISPVDEASIEDLVKRLNSEGKTAYIISKKINTPLLNIDAFNYYTQKAMEKAKKIINFSNPQLTLILLPYYNYNSKTYFNYAYDNYNLFITETKVNIAEGENPYNLNSPSTIMYTEEQPEIDVQLVKKALAVLSECPVLTKFDDFASSINNAVAQNSHLDPTDMNFVIGGCPLEMLDINKIIQSYIIDITKKVQSDNLNGTNKVNTYVVLFDKKYEYNNIAEELYNKISDETIKDKLLIIARVPVTDAKDEFNYYFYTSNKISGFDDYIKDNIFDPDKKYGDDYFAKTKTSVNDLCELFKTLESSGLLYQNRVSDKEIKDEANKLVDDFLKNVSPANKHWYFDNNFKCYPNNLSEFFSDASNIEQAEAFETNINLLSNIYNKSFYIVLQEISSPLTCNEQLNTFNKYAEQEFKSPDGTVKNIDKTDYAVLLIPYYKYSTVNSYGTINEEIDYYPNLCANNINFRNGNIPESIIIKSGKQDINIINEDFINNILANIVVERSPENYQKELDWLIDNNTKQNKYKKYVVGNSAVKKDWNSDFYTSIQNSNSFNNLNYYCVLIDKEDIDPNEVVNYLIDNSKISKEYGLLLAYNPSYTKGEKYAVRSGVFSNRLDSKFSVAVGNVTDNVDNPFEYLTNATSAINGILSSGYVGEEKRYIHRKNGKLKYKVSLIILMISSIRILINLFIQTLII